MWSNNIPSPLIAIAILTILRPVAANWMPDLFQSFDVLHTPEKRCANPCGYYGQLCCAAGQVCYTDTAGQAQCGNAGNPGNQGSGGNPAGQWQYFTTTYVQTDYKTITTTFSTFIPYATPPPNTLNCAYAQGQTPCGNVCCLAGQYCAAQGSCMQIPGGSSQYYNSLYTVTSVVNPTASPGIRPTTQTVLTLTSPGSGTTPFQTAVGTNGAVIAGPQPSGGGLSGGAIAGIVIGVIIGIIILILICACCIFKGLIDGLLAIFGLGPRRKKRTEEVYVEERHSHRSGAGRRWWGQPKRKTEVIEEKKSSSGFARIASVAGILGGLAVILGLKRRHDRKDNASVSYGSSAYYSDYYGSATSPSSVTRSRSRSRSRYSRR